MPSTSDTRAGAVHFCYTYRKPHECVFGVKISHECLFLAGKGTRPKVECLSQPRKDTSVIFSLQKYTSAVFCLSHALTCFEILLLIAILPSKAMRMVKVPPLAESRHGIPTSQISCSTQCSALNFTSWRRGVSHVVRDVIVEMTSLCFGFHVSVVLGHERAHCKTYSFPTDSSVPYLDGARA